MGKPKLPSQMQILTDNAPPKATDKRQLPPHLMGEALEAALWSTKPTTSWFDTREIRIFNDLSQGDCLCAGQE
jgi:hypothetical protein